MKLSRSVKYAVRATVQLARLEQHTRVPCRMLAESGQMPERFLLHILRALVSSGILRSTRGVDGGYALNRPPEQISLMDLIEAVEGPVASDESGILAAPMARVNECLKRELAATKLSELASAR